MKTLWLLAAAIVALSPAQPWQQLDPSGATVVGMTGVPGYPDEIYFVTDGFPSAVFHTTDAGASWAVIETIPDRLAALAVDPAAVRTLYAAGRTGRVWRTTDAGATWALRGTMPGDLRVWNLAVNSANTAELFASAAQTSGDSVAIVLLRSANSGQTWTDATAATATEAAAPLLLIVPGPSPTVYVGGSTEGRPRLLLTIDNGANWTDHSEGLAGRRAFACGINPIDSLMLYCATGAGIYRTTDRGANWYRRLAAPAYSLRFSPASGNPGFAGSENLVFLSADRGSTWSAETSLFAGTLTRHLWLNPASGLEAYAGNGRGVFHTLDRGFTWTDRTASLRRLSVPWLEFAPDSQTMFTCPTGCALQRSVNQGRTWASLRPFPGSGLATGLAVNPRSPDTIAVVTAFDSRLHLTIDGGDSWVHLSIATDLEPLGIAYHPFQPDTIYAWGSRRDSAAGPARFKLYKSVDRGQTWSSLLTRGNTGYCVGFDFHSTDTLLAWGIADNAPALYWSTDRGSTWSNRSTGLTGSGAVRDVKTSPASRQTLFAALEDGVFRSDNSGGTWDDIGLADVSTVLPDTAGLNNVYAGTDTQGVWRTTNGGVFWDRDTLGAVSRAVSFLCRHPAARSIVYCGTGGAGLLYRGTIGIAEDGWRAAGSGPRLSASPSVVRNKVTIRLAPVATGGRTTVDLFTAEGRRLLRIADRPTRPSLLRWRPPAELSAGVYVLVCRTGDVQDATRICLTR